jgi:phage I-like protein
LRSRVNAFSAARKPSRTPPTGAAQFSAQETASAKKLGITPEEYTARRAKLIKRA